MIWIADDLTSLRWLVRALKAAPTKKAAQVSPRRLIFCVSHASRNAPMIWSNARGPWPHFVVSWHFLK